MDNQEKIIILEEKLKTKEYLLKSLEKNYDSLFNYFNSKYPDEITKYLKDE